MTAVLLDGNHLLFADSLPHHLAMSEIKKKSSLLFIAIHQIFSLARDWSQRVTWPNIPQLKLRNIREHSPIFKTARAAKNIWRIINTVATIWRKNVLGYLSLGIICSSTLTVFRELRSHQGRNQEFSKAGGGGGPPGGGFPTRPRLSPGLFPSFLRVFGFKLTSVQRGGGSRAPQNLPPPYQYPCSQTYP